MTACLALCLPPVSVVFELCQPTFHSSQAPSSREIYFSCASGVTEFNEVAQESARAVNLNGSASSGSQGREERCAGGNP